VKYRKPSALLGFKTILHKKCRSGKNSRGSSRKFLGAGSMYVPQNEISKSLKLVEIFFY
jgi:hypothetical protein